MSLARYFHTARHLRPLQVAARAWRKVHLPQPDTRAAPVQRQVCGLHVSAVEMVPTLVGPQTFRFLNVERACAAAGDWQPTGAGLLWVYNLHYFADLNARDALARGAWHRRLLERWVTENPPARGPGWDPYPVSRRVVNWVKWTLCGNELSPACRHSLAVQTRWLRGRLEYHLLGNHLLANASALVHAGLYFQGPEADGWYARGMRILDRELREQVLGDGGHFERSTMYHAAALEELLDLVNALRTFGYSPPPQWLAAIERMRGWLQVMSHPDGEIAFFNDAAFGIAPNALQLEAFACRLGLGCLPEPPGHLATLASSGYVRARMGSAYLVCDCAAVGPDHLPAHAHADTLSFELSIAGQRLLVNSGTSVYGSDAERQRQRGTGAHNTVIVDGNDSSEVWAGFRVARRARAHLSTARATDHEVVICASHDGYARLPGRNQHQRCWRLDDRGLTLEDRLSGQFGSAEARFHVHPQVGAHLASAAQVLLTCPDGTVARMTFEGAQSVQITPATWHPRFGVADANWCVVARFSGATLQTVLCWAQRP